jgi:hypothetical protein
MSAQTLFLILIAFRRIIEDIGGTGTVTRPNPDESLRLRLTVYNFYQILRSILNHAAIHYDRDIPRLDFEFHQLLRLIHEIQGTTQYGPISHYPTR